MIVRLCDELAVPLREQNRVLLAGGFAPAHPEHRLTEAPMADVAEAIEAILSAHLPYPREVTVSELAIEAFYPADAATRQLLSARASG